MTHWIEVADGVFQRRYQPVDVSIVVVRGGEESLVVDTRNNPAEGRELVDDVDRHFGGRIVGVVNTHAHYDHTFGNQEFGPGSALNVPIYGHERIARHFTAFEAPRLAAVQRDPSSEPDKSWQDVTLVPPTHPIAEPFSLSVGGREVLLLPQTPAHTDTDLVIHVPDARVWVVGDLVEQSGPPMYGSGSYPLAWGEVLLELLGAIGADDVIVPGHGSAVDREFVVIQAEQLVSVAELIRQAWHRGLTVSEALESDLQWPWPAEVVRSAVEQGFRALAGD